MATRESFLGAQDRITSHVFFMDATCTQLVTERCWPLNDATLLRRFGTGYQTSKDHGSWFTECIIGQRHSYLFETACARMTWISHIIIKPEQKLCSSIVG